MKVLLVLASFGIIVSGQYPDALGAPGTSYGAPSQSRNAAEFHSSSTVPFQGGYPAAAAAPASRGPSEYLPPQSSPVLYSMPVVQRESSPSGASGGYPGSGASGGYPGSGDRSSNGGYPSSSARAPAGGYSQAQSSPQYNPPAAQYGAPQSASQAQYSAPQAAPQYSAPQAAPQPQYGAPQAAPQPQYSAPRAPQYDTQSAPQYSAPAPQYGAPSSAAQNSPTQQYGAPGAGGDRGSQGFPTESDTKISSGSGDDQGSGPVQQVHKHVYVHVAPDEEPEPKEEKSPKSPLIPEKHYKILFIKAPTPPPYEAPEIPEAQPAPETKTLVYVLLKKPEPTPALKLADVPATKPSKPEVYFIRYKSPEGQGKPSSDAGNPDGQDGGANNGANNGLDDGRAQGGYSNGASSGGPGGPREYGVPN